MPIRIDGDNATATPGITGGDADTGLVFGTNEIEAVTGGTTRFTVESNGNCTIENGNLVFPAGNGIDFSATNDGSGASNISELFHDYEEGEFTPVFRGGTTAGTYTGTFTGFYTRIGNRVLVDIQMSNIDSDSPGSGVTEIAGLPFPCNSNVSGSTGSIRYDSWNVNDAADGLVPIIGNGNDYLQLYEVGDDRGDSSTGVGDITLDGTDLFISIAYQV